MKLTVAQKSGAAPVEREETCMTVPYAQDLFARIVSTFRLTPMTILFVYPVTSRGGRKSVMQIPM